MEADGRYHNWFRKDRIRMFKKTSTTPLRMHLITKIFDDPQQHYKLCSKHLFAYVNIIASLPTRLDPLFKVSNIVFFGLHKLF
jgi:hypothetical protein